jgi:transcription antitermination factor NusG
VSLREGWYALHVKSHAERSVARVLAEKGYEHFLPLYTCRRRWSDRVKMIELPLFPNYLFSRITATSVGRVIDTPGVMRIVGAANVPLPIDDSEIEALKQIVASRLAAEPWPFLHIGQSVAITAGPLSGLRGVLVRVASRDRLVVSVSLLQRSVAVEIDEAWVEALPASASTPASIAHSAAAAAR